MPSGTSAGAVAGDAAEQALAYLTEISPDLRGGAILDSSGAVLAASSAPESWSRGAVALLDVADRAGSEPADQVHVATERGEVFAVREAGLTAVAVTERFVLASLTAFDMRSVLRDLAAGTGSESGGGGA